MVSGHGIGVELLPFKARLGQVGPISVKKASVKKASVKKRPFKKPCQAGALLDSPRRCNALPITYTRTAPAAAAA